MWIFTSPTIRICSLDSRTDSRWSENSLKKTLVETLCSFEYGGRYITSKRGFNMTKRTYSPLSEFERVLYTRFNFLNAQRITAYQTNTATTAVIPAMIHEVITIHV